MQGQWLEFHRKKRNIHFEVKKLPWKKGPVGAGGNEFNGIEFGRIILTADENGWIFSDWNALYTVRRCIRPAKPADPANAQRGWESLARWKICDCPVYAQGISTKMLSNPTHWLTCWSFIVCVMCKIKSGFWISGFVDVLQLSLHLKIIWQQKQRNILWCGSE